MTILGIDGCRYGWCVAAQTFDRFHISLFYSFEEIILFYPAPAVVLIDIPIGLGDKTTSRDVESFAREILKPARHHSIFTPPVREALSAGSYREAKTINKKITGKMISIQSWNISNKIKELDSFLIHRPEFKKMVHEAHPEICFKYLHDGQMPVHSKNAPNGQGMEERLDILSKFEKNIRKHFNEGSSGFKASQVKKDDIVDALCLVVTAKNGLKSGFKKISGANKMDAQDIEMSMYYYQPAKL